MPFVSSKQRKWMWANRPALAKKWTKKYGSKSIEEKEKEKEKEKEEKKKKKKK